MTLAQAITNYQATRCENSFEVIFESIYKNDRNIIYLFSNRYKLEDPDVESLINRKIFETAVKYEGDSDKFKNAVYRAVKEGCIDLVRNRNYREKNKSEVMWEDDDGVLTEIYEIIEVAPTTEDKDIEGIIKKRDQRQLITFLLSKVDDKILTSASTFISVESYRKAAEQLGTTDKTVKSRIRSLSKKFDENQFGNYYDYFTTATVHIG